MSSELHSGMVWVDGYRIWGKESSHHELYVFAWLVELVERCRLSAQIVFSSTLTFGEIFRLRCQERRVWMDVLCFLGNFFQSHVTLSLFCSLYLKKLMTYCLEPQLSSIGPSLVERRRSTRSLGQPPNIKTVKPTLVTSNHSTKSGEHVTERLKTVPFKELEKVSCLQ